MIKGLPARNPQSLPASITAGFSALVIVSLLVEAVVAPQAFPLLVGHFYDRDLLAFVHLNTLGIIGAGIIGLSYQRVLAGLDVASESRRALVASFWCYLSGLVTFLIGFFQTWHPVLATGGAILIIGLSLYVWIMLRALRATGSSTVIRWYLQAALLNLIVGFSLGFVLAGSKGTWFLGAETMQVLAAHAWMMLAGWVLIMLHGIYYLAQAESWISDPVPSRRGAAIELGLLGGGAWLGSLALLLSFGRLWVLGAAIALALGQALFVAQVFRQQVFRNPERFGARMHFRLGSAGAGLLAALILIDGLLRESPILSPHWTAAAWLAIGGMGLMALLGYVAESMSPVTTSNRVTSRSPLNGLLVVVCGAWTLAALLAVRAILDGNVQLAEVAGYLTTTCLVLLLVVVAGRGLARKFLEVPDARSALERRASVADQ